MSSLLLRSAPRRYTNAAHSLQTFRPDNNMVPTPEPGIGPRPYKGLNMNKLSYPKFVRFNEYPKIVSGPAREYPGIPCVDTMTAEEVSSFHGNFLYQQHYTGKDIAKSLLLSFTGHHVTMVFGAVIMTIPWIIVGLMLQYEPKEFQHDDFFENQIWHTQGQYIDHHAFSQYLEARRAKRFRKMDVDPVDYIPAEFRSEEQIATHGPGKPLGKKYHDHNKA